MNETCMKHALSMPGIDGCPYCRIVELEKQLKVSRGNLTRQKAQFKRTDNGLKAMVSKLTAQNAKLVEALEDINCIAAPPDRLDSGVKLDSIYDIAAAALKEVVQELGNNRDYIMFNLMESRWRSIDEAAGYLRWAATESEKLK